MRCTKLIGLVLASALLLTNLARAGSGSVTSAAGPLGGGGIATIQELDGAPAVTGASVLKVTNATLTDNGDGSVTLAIGGGSGMSIGVTTVTSGTAGSLLTVGAGPLLQQVNLTGLVVGNGASQPTAYAGCTGTNQVLRVLGASGACTFVTITSAYVDTSIWTGTATSGILKASSQGVLTAASVLDYNNHPVKAEVGTTYTVVDGDLTKLVTHSNAGAIAVTLPDAAGAGFDANWYYITKNIGVGDVTITPTTSTIDGGASLVLTTDQWAIIFSDGTNYFSVKYTPVTSEADTLQSVFDRGKTITNANSFANAERIGDGTTDTARYTHATYGPQENCVVATVENDCNYTRWLLTGKTFSFLANDRTTSIGTLTAGASSGSWTNVTLDTEATGNVITTTSKVNFPTVGCSGTTGTLMLDTNATLAPTATCTAGSTNTTLMQGYADFPDSDGEYQFQTNFRLPADWAGAIDAQLYWKAAATSGDVVWQIQTLCRADAEIEDAAWNTADVFAADTAKGTTLQLNTAAKTGLTTTGCAAGELFYVKVFRQRTHASDTITGVVSLKSIELTLRRAQ